MTNIEPHVIRAAEQHMAALGVARATTALAVIDTLNTENRKLREELAAATTKGLEGLTFVIECQREDIAQLRHLLDAAQHELTVATVAAQAASTFYWAEWAGEKTYLTPAQVKERFADAMVEYREATGADHG